MVKANAQQRRGSLHSSRNKTTPTFASVAAQLSGFRTKRQQGYREGGTCESCCVPGHPGRPGPPGHPGQPGIPGSPGRPGN